MKKINHTQFLCGARRALCATAVATLVSTLSAQAQSPSSSRDDARRNAITPATPGSIDQSTQMPTPPGAPSNVRLSGSLNGKSVTGVSSEPLSWSDKRFLTKAAEDGHAEVQLAQLAADRTTNAEVRTFAQKIVSAHTAANSALGTLASAKMVELDKDEGQDRFYRRLSKMSGADFDREFVEHMVDSHEKSVKMFEKASTDAKDTEVRSFAAQQLASLRDHQQQAQTLQRSTLSSGRTDATNSNYNRTPGLNGSTGTSPISSSTGTDATGQTPGSIPSSPSDSSTRGSNPTGGSSSTDRGTSTGTDPIRR